MCLFADSQDDADVQVLAAAILTAVCVEKAAYERIRSVFPQVIVGQLAVDLFAAAQLVYTEISCPTITWSPELRLQAVAALKVNKAQQKTCS
jgi:hypothetical protein